jgi:hypothetical protein
MPVTFSPGCRAAKRRFRLYGVCGGVSRTHYWACQRGLQEEMSKSSAPLSNQICERSELSFSFCCGFASVVIVLATEMICGIGMCA